MCRILSYLGNPVVIEEFLYKPDNSFIKQSYHPKYMSHLLNLAGFGMVAWDKSSYDPALPFIYKTINLPFYDENLKNLSSKITPNCLLAHLRGVPYDDRHVVSMQNVHPFIFGDCQFALAHNGALADFELMKYDFLEFIMPRYAKCIQGTTDSEWIYAIFLSQLSKASHDSIVHNVMEAIIETLKIIKKVRENYHVRYASPVNLFITNGNLIAATRFVFDYGWRPLDATVSTHFAYHSLWYTFGEQFGFYNNEYRMKNGKNKSSIIIASEPLTEDTTTWIEVPEYSLVISYKEDEVIKILSQDIHI